MKFEDYIIMQTSVYGGGEIKSKCLYKSASYITFITICLQSMEIINLKMRRKKRTKCYYSHTIKECNNLAKMKTDRTRCVSRCLCRVYPLLTGRAKYIKSATTLLKLRCVYCHLKVF